MTIAAGLGILNPLNIQWKRMDKEFIQMTDELAVAIFMKVMETVEAVFQAAEVHKAAMMIDPNPLEYNYWSTGWPEMFSDTHPDVPY